MGSICNSEFEHMHCKHRELEKPFVFQMRNGYWFRIDRATLIYPQTLLRQLHEQGRAEMKFCVRDDEELLGADDDGREQWELVLFPMYRKGAEIAHGSIVGHQDSILNGNLTVENWRAISPSSNYCDPEYREIQDPLTKFVGEYVQGFLDRQK